MASAVVMTGRERAPAVAGLESPAAGRADPAGLTELRHFHLGDPAVRPRPLAADWLPALLGRYRDSAGLLRYDYPLLLAAPGAAEPGPEPGSDWLRRSVEGVAPEAGQGRILKDNLPRLERRLRQLLDGATRPVAAAGPLAQAGEAVQRELQLSEAQRHDLQGHLERLGARLPAGSQWLAYSRYSALYLLLHGITHRLLPRRQVLAQEIRRLAQGLKALLDLERRKSDAARQPEMLAGSIGTAGPRYVDPAALAALLGQPRGSQPLGAERRARIESAVPVLEAFLNGDFAPSVTVLLHLAGADDPELQDIPGCAVQVADDPCARAMTLYDAQARDYARLFRAVRIARLELANGYIPAEHDPWLAAFGWQAFAREELLAVPPVVVLASAGAVIGAQLHSFSRLLSSARPVQILLEARPGFHPGMIDDRDSPADDRVERDFLADYRVEPGYLAIAHRRTLVQQSSAARPGHLWEGLLAALDATCTGLHLVDAAMAAQDGVSPWLAAGAALESRAHPLFRVNPEAGASWAARLTLEGNPRPEADWPVYAWVYQDQAGAEHPLELPFTFADYALLEPALRPCFSAVPDDLEGDALVPLADYPDWGEGEAEPAGGRIPFLWVVDGRGMPHRVVISRALLLACRDRRDFWHTLQELAGVNNRHVELAVARTRAELEAAAAAERERLQAEHEAALERVRRETAGEAMQRLTRVLLGMDWMQAGRAMEAPARIEMPLPPPVEVEEGRPAEPPLDPEAETASLLEGPWIDSALCTSCNECITINPRLFVYNANRQATIGDPRAGSYAQLVQAAQTCPACCIHPGKPPAPAEPGAG